MTGSLVVKGVKSHQYRSFKVDGSDWPPKYWKVLLDLEGNVSIAFSDARRFARVRLQVRHTQSSYLITSEPPQLWPLVVQLL